jgi:integrase
MISQLRTLYAFADRFDLLIGPDGQPVRNPMAKVDPPKVKRVIKDWLERGEYEALLEAAGSPEQRFLAVSLGMTAMRIGETGMVAWREVDLAGVPGSILIRSGKTDQSVRRITMTSELRAHLVAHRERQRGRGLADLGTPVLCSRHGNPITEQQANRTLKAMARRAGITKTVSCHTLRRSWAMEAIKRMSIESVAAHLGHANSATTAAHYARVQHSQVEAEVMRAFG